MFGLPMNVPFVSYWGARAIYKNESIDLLPDRQAYDGEKNEPFVQWLNGYALPWLRAKVKELHLGTDDAQVITLSQFKYELRACTNSSYGYLYIGAVEHKQDQGTSLINPASKTEEKVILINGQPFVVDAGMVPVGTKGNIKVNGIGPATVVGYFNEKYTGNHLLACLMVEVHQPPEWMVKQNMEAEAKKLVKEGKLPKAKGAYGNQPAERSAAYREWKKNWKMGPIPLFPNDFQPS